MRFNRDELRDKVLGCWLGKNIGGTLGAPMEWKRRFNDVTFYTQELGGEPLPNDDLDIQLMWLIALEKHGPMIDADVLADYWSRYLIVHWAEYGTARANLRMGLAPPLSGTVDNAYKHSCGAFIRSEIWACVAPGQPGTAAWYALQDAMVDHGDGEGTYAEIFTASLESAAFVESDIRTLIDIGLSYIPEECAVAGATRCAIDCFDNGMSWRDARNTILEKYRGRCHLGNVNMISQEDIDRGFDTGVLGYDVPSNIGILVIGLLYGKGDFDETMCITINCGEDTDCTGATVGSIFGIIHGAEAIPEKWIEPIGHGIKTVCINTHELRGIADNVDDLTDRSMRMAELVARVRKLPVSVGDEPTDTSEATPEHLFCGDNGRALCRNLGGTTHEFLNYTVAVDYGEKGPLHTCDEPASVTIRVWNKNVSQTQLQVRWLAEEWWDIHPAPVVSLFSPDRSIEDVKGAGASAPFTLFLDKPLEGMTRLAVEITTPGRAECMLVPVTLLNGGAHDLGD